jgi:hypothetical protein
MYMYIFYKLYNLKPVYFPHVVEHSNNTKLWCVKHNFPSPDFGIMHRARVLPRYFEAASQSP